MTIEAKEKSEGAELFDAFRRETGLSLKATGKIFDVSHVTILKWSSGLSRPDEQRRRAIAKWTRNRVPVESWALPDDKAPKDVEPYSKPRKSKSHERGEAA